VTDPLTQWALVGTERQDHIASPPEPLAQSALAKLTDLPLEQRMLLAAGVCGVASTAAGRPLPKSDGDSSPPSANETRPACSAKVARRLEDMLRGHHKELLLEALTLLDGAGLRLPHVLLPLALGVRTPAHRRAVRPVLGERGAWLARINPAWAWVTAGDAPPRDAKDRARENGAPGPDALARAIALAEGVLHFEPPVLTVHPPLRGVGARSFWLSQLLSDIPPSHWTSRFSAGPEVLVRAAEKTEWAAALGEGWTKAALLHQDATWLAELWDFWQRCDEKVVSPAVANAMLVQILQRLPAAEAARCVEPLFGDAKTHIDLSMALCALGTPWPESISVRYIEALHRELRAMSPRWRAILTSLRDAATALSPAELAPALTSLGPLATDAGPRALVEFIEVLRIRHELVQEIRP